jgi:hypothetical protein
VGLIYDLHVDDVEPPQIPDLDALLRDQRLSLVGLCGENLGQSPQLQRVQLRVDRVDAIMSQNGHHAADGIDDPRPTRRQRPWNMQLPSQRSQHALSLLVVRARHLGQPHLSAGLVQFDQIG